MSCSGTGELKNKGETASEIAHNFEASNLTIQTLVSGVEGGDNRIMFVVNIDTKNTGVEPDSLFVLGYKLRLFCTDESTNMYKANSVKNESVVVEDKTDVVISFKKHAYQLRVLNMEIEKLERLSLF